VFGFNVESIRKRRNGVYIWCSRNFFMKVRVQKFKTVTSRKNRMVTLRAHFQILTDIMKYC